MYIDFTIWFLLYIFWLPLLSKEPTLNIKNFRKLSLSRSSRN
jgi:hypothetical protein